MFRDDSRYLKEYWKLIPKSEPVDEWDDRNRLYAIRALLGESAGHPGSDSREMAYNDMLFLCARYAPGCEGLGRYDTEKDIGVVGVEGGYDVLAGVRMG